MKKVLQTAWGQWLLGLFLSLVLGGLIAQIWIMPLVSQINVLSQDNRHISQKLKSLRQYGNGAFWSASQLYRWLDVSQKHFGVHLVSVDAESEGIALAMVGPLQNIQQVLQQLSVSGLKSLAWQRESGQMEVLLNAVSVQETDHWVGEAGSALQHYCVYQSGQGIRLVKKEAVC